MSEISEAENTKTDNTKIEEKVNDINDETIETENAVSESNDSSESDEKKSKKEKKPKKEKKAKKDKEKDNLDENENISDTDKKKKSKKEEKKNPEDVNIVKDLLWLIVYIGSVILICFLIIKFVGTRSRVDGSSMNPTLHDGDNLWVDKLSYTFGDPKRFDIIIFNPNGNEKITYVKRIIGLPGETVSMDLDGKIYINGQLLNENYALDEPFLPSSIGILSGNNEIVLGDDEYFVLGDNRNNSMDSRRSDPGNVKRDYIIGKVVLRIYPFSKFGFVK
ncbi:MAG: signal peptidase I [Lachnospiraceae bacterium]|nr:signal peptidase I [Lachnospiraceae bacterium]